MNLTPADLNTMRNALVDLQANLDDTGPCDHPVNICVCGLRTTLNNLADLFHRITDGQVGYLAQREPAFDVDTDDPKQLAAEEASSAAEAMGNMRDIAMTMMQEMHDFRNRQLAREADALKGTING